MRIVVLLLFLLGNGIPIAQAEYKSFDGTLLKSRCNPHKTLTWDQKYTIKSGLIEILDTEIDVLDIGFWYKVKQWGEVFTVGRLPIWTELSCTTWSPGSCKNCLEYLVDGKLFEECQNSRGAFMSVKDCAARFEFVPWENWVRD